MIGVSLINQTFFETNKTKVKVGYVVPNSPAEKSGIKIDDIILKVGNKDIKNSYDVITEITQNGVNKSIVISLKRGNKLIKLQVKPTDINNLSKN